jgi:hypothetical protein
MALSANRSLTRRNTGNVQTRSVTVKTSQVIYQDAFVGLNAAGKLVVCSNSTTIRFLGIAAGVPDGSTFPITGDGTKTVNVEWGYEVLAPLVTAMTVGLSLTTNIYCVDDQTATNATTLGPVMGTLEEFVAANSGWIALRGTKGTLAS